jgi:hypothetical protein
MSKPTRNAIRFSLCALCALAANLQAAPAVKITPPPPALEITIDDTPFTTYRCAPTPDDPAWHRPYF